MADQRCRVTVIGSTMHADVAIPALAPVGEYAYVLAERLREPQADDLPAAWSLRVCGGSPLPPYACLDSAGVIDGQLLYLCDLTEGEYDEPLVLEIGECVAGTMRRLGDRRWTVSLAAPVTLLLGAAWLVAAMATWLFTQGSRATAAGSLALIAGVALAVAAWLGQSERLGLTRAVRLVMAGAVVPCLAITGWFAGLTSTGGQLATHHALGAAVVRLAIGALAGSLAALSAVPGIETVALAALAGVASLIACVLDLAGASAGAAVAITAVCGYWLVALAPGLAVRLAASWEHLSRAEDTEQAVTWARGLTLAGTCTGAVTAGLGVVLAAFARNPFDLALAGVVSTALLLRAGTCRLLTEAVPVVMAGLTGLFALAMALPRFLGLAGVAPALVQATLGLVMLAAGVAGTTTRAVQPGPDDLDPPMADPPSAARKALRIALTVWSIATIPVALGTLGLYAQIISTGRHL